MVFGRIDIYWPDGRLESYLVDKPTVSVGRAEGNAIALDTDTISRYHFSLVMEQGQMTITDLDSANGTFVDGVLLRSNEPRVLGDVEEIQVGALRIIWRQVDESPTMPIATNEEEDTARVERDTADFRLEFDTMVLHAWPAASASSELAVVNLGNELRRFSVRVSGMPGDWLRVNRPEMDIHPGETAYVLINVKPPRRPTTTPNHYQVIVEVVPADQPEMVLRGMLDVTVHTYSGFGIALGGQRDVDEPVDVFLQNQGSGMLEMNVSFKDPQQALKVDLPPAPIQLQPGQNLRLPVAIKERQLRITGAIQTYPFIIQAQANNAAGFVVAEAGEVRLAPRFPVWQIITGVGIALAALIVGLLAVLGVLTPPNPTIESVAVNTEQVQQGEPLVVSWEGEDIETINISVNQVLVYENLPGDQTSVELDTSSYSGVMSIGVFGEAGRLSTSAETSAFVFVPFGIQDFSVVPFQVVRNVVSNLDITWHVPEAAFVQVNGLADFSNNFILPNQEYAAQDTLSVSGIPGEQLEITLYAENDAGEAVSERRVIPIIDPQCTLIEETTLHEGPDERYQVVRTEPADTTLVVEAQHTNGWLRVALPNNLTGWAERNSFTCADTFDVANLRTESNVPALPTLVPTDLPPTEATPSDT